MSKTPFIIIHLSIQKKSKNKKAAEKKEKTTEDGGSPDKKQEEEEEDKNRVIYKPSIKDCEHFIMNSMDMVIKSTNMINDLECDLMPFLQKVGQPNFKIDRNFPWIKDALIKLNQLFNDNVSGPIELL